MREKLLELLRQSPFQPFRLRLSSGIVHVVRHPKQVMVSTHYAIIGIPVNDAPGPEIADSVIISLVHVVQIEPFAPAAPATAN